MTTPSTAQPSEEIVVVSGLPRSGTSMMMKMIDAAGIPALTDNLRSADEDNPRGYYEYEPVKTTRQNPAWVAGAHGKVVKMVHLLLRDLPEGHHYRVVMMHRELDEVVASQRKMLERGGRKGAAMPAEALKRVFAAQMHEIIAWVRARPHFKILDVRYNEVVADPKGQSARIAEFLGVPAAADAMAAVVEASLYRNRK
jgi:hypothetical protein